MQDGICEVSASQLVLCQYGLCRTRKDHWQPLGSTILLACYFALLMHRAQI